jgi:hypothetical protein
LGGTRLGLEDSAKRGRRATAWAGDFGDRRRLRVVLGWTSGNFIQVKLVLAFQLDFSDHDMKKTFFG